MSIRTSELKGGNGLLTPTKIRIQIDTDTSLGGKGRIGTVKEAVHAKLLTAVLPLFIYGLFFSVFNLLTIIHSFERRISLIQQIVKDLANGNYRQNSLIAWTRDELSLLLMDFNTFLKFNKTFLQELNASVGISAQTAEALSSNMKVTSGAVKGITESVSAVQNHIQNQSNGILRMQTTLQRIAQSIEALDRSQNRLPYNLRKLCGSCQRLITAAVPLWNR